MNIKEFISGIIIGIAKIIPGLSGAIIMISFNLYDRAINSITNFFDDIKNNGIFLFNLGIGIIIGIVSFSKVIDYFITHYFAYTTSLFIGLILGGIPIVCKKINKSKKNNIIIIVSLTSMLLLSLNGINNTYIVKNNFIDIIIFFISGFLEALGSILPGISSTALLMLLGVYNTYIDTISNLFNLNKILINLRYLIPFTTGLLFGFISITLLVNYLFKNYYEETFSFIIGVSISSILLLLIKVFLNITSLYSILICVLIIFVSYNIMKKI